MDNYLTTFNTYAEYSAATLNYPNVSLIEPTGKLYYNRNIFSRSVLGDILMWDVANQKLVTTINGQWDSTTYPIASYEPIAINVYPAEQTSDGKARFMALKWASNASASGNASAVGLMWGPNGTDITSGDQTALNGRANTDKAVAAMPNTSGNTQAEYPIFYAVNQFYTNGTSAGDWYVPSKAELDLYLANYSSFYLKIEAIKNADSSIVSSIRARMWTSTEVLTTTACFLDSNGFYGSQPKSYSLAVRGMIAL